jgi:hypothetical protein
MRKIIKITETELVKIVEKIINEQTGPGITSNTNLDTPKKTIKGYSCVPENMKLFVDYVVTNKSSLIKELKIDYTTLFLLTKASIGIIGRETKFGNFFEDSDVWSERLRSAGLGSLVDCGLRKKYGPNATQSLGVGQFTPGAWKKYGLDKSIGDYNNSFNEIKQGLGVLYSLNIRYKKALANGLKTNPSVNPILSKYGVVKNINGTGNHALDMAILGHNMPEESTIYPYCRTNHELYLAPCFRTKHSPYRKTSSFDPNNTLLQKVKDPKLKQFPGELTVKKNEVVDGFFPNLKGPKHTGIGYVEEVSKYMNSMNCF